MVRRGGVRLLRPRNLSTLPLTTLRLPQARGGCLREQGIHSSQIIEWRKLRDAGVLEGKQPGEKIGKLTPEQAEIARLKPKLELTDQRLATRDVALEIM